MSRSDTYANDYLKHLLQNAAVAKVGDAGGLQPSASAGSLYLSLHTADPTAGDQTTSETAYTGYGGRVAVARTGGAWTVTGRQSVNVAEILWGLCTASPGAAITHVGIGTDSSGAGKLLEVSALAASLTIVVGSRPRIAAGALQINA